MRDGLQFQIRAGHAGELLLKPRDLLRAGVRQHGVTAAPGALVKARSNFAGSSASGWPSFWLTCATMLLATAKRACSRSCSNLLDVNANCFRSAFVSERPSFFSCAAMACFCAASAWLCATGVVGVVELFPQIVEVKAQVVARPVFGQHAAFAVENFSAHGGKPHGAIRLRFQMRLVFARGNDLHPPQAREQNEQARRQHHRHEAELRVVLFQFVKNEHGAQSTVHSQSPQLRPRRRRGVSTGDCGLETVTHSFPRRISRSGRKLVSVRGW